MQHDFVLLDRSGSMQSQWGEALSACNSYVKKLADDKVDTGVTLATFDTGMQGHIAFDVIRDRIIPTTWRAVTDKDAVPRGSTPLNDAVGRIVNLAEAGNYDKVAIIIMTDGHENASREMNVAQAKAALDRCRAKGWQVIFLGASYDNVRQAESYGAAHGQHVNASTRNLGATMDSLSVSRSAYGATGQAMAFSDDEKEKLKQK